MKKIKQFLKDILALAVDFFNAIPGNSNITFGFGVGLTGDQVKLYVKDAYKMEREGRMELPTMHDKIFKVEASVEGNGDRVDQVLTAGRLRRHEAENETIRFKSPTAGWSWYVKYWLYSDGMFFSKEANDDTRKLGNIVKDLAKTWGKMVRVEEEELGADVFNDGGALAGHYILNGSHAGQTDPSGNLMYDSKPTFTLAGNARATKGGGTYVNSVANLTLSVDNLETVYNLHTTTNNRDERDVRVENPCDTLLVQSGAERFKADKILTTNGQNNSLPGSQLNDKNVYYNLLQPMDWQYLDDGAGTYPAFYVGKRQSDSWQFRKRQRPEIRFFRDEKDLGYYTSINMRMGILLKDWRTWTRGGGTSA